MSTSGYCEFGCTGLLIIDGQDLNTPAWDAPSLVRLWAEADVRGENKVMPSVPGVRGNPHRLTATEFDLPFFIRGDVDQTGAPTADAWTGLEANLQYLYDNVFTPVTIDRGSRSGQLILPSGTSRYAEVQLEPLRFASEPEDPLFVEATIHLTVLTGRFA